ncbi:2-dehydropantoate 2-reductase N-terminal domain-containing protein [Curtobacterium sp. RRHDQ66]|uniref:2-dehydropantoate 2-reductase N-terminal domain-containing protein n=1 Tax=Curtobacterium guangdongense TaxID=3413380 RepID=UPI003BF11CFA
MDASLAVVGPGAIGTVVAAALHDAGRTPLLFGRTARDHLELVDTTGRIVVPGPVQTDPRPVTDPVDPLRIAIAVCGFVLAVYLFVEA